MHRAMRSHCQQGCTNNFPPTNKHDQPACGTIVPSNLQKKPPLKTQNVSRSKTTEAEQQEQHQEKIYTRGITRSHMITLVKCPHLRSHHWNRGTRMTAAVASKLIMFETNAAQVSLHLKLQSNALLATPGKVSHGKSKYNHVHNRHQ